MHHKKHRVGTKKEVRRIDKKRHRQAERTVLEGGKPRQVHDYSWTHRPEQTPILDGAVPAPRKAKPTPKKERCPSNPDKRAHEFVQDSWPSKRPRRWYWYAPSGKYDNVTEYHRICLHCGKEQWKTKVEGKYGDSGWKDRP